METNLDTEINANLVYSKLSRNYKLQEELQKLKPSKFEKLYVIILCFSLPAVLFAANSYYNFSTQTIWTLSMGITILSSLLIVMVQYIENIHKRIDLLIETMKNDS